MARKTHKEIANTEAVQDRLTTEGHLRVDAVAKETGGTRGATRRYSAIHPSLDGLTTGLATEGFESGTVTTPSGLSVEVTKGPRAKKFSPHGQGLTPQRGKAPLPPVSEGVSQRYEQRIGHEHSAEKVAELQAEADAVAARPNPLRSDGHVDAVAALHAPSMGGNSYGQRGRVSARAKRGDANLQGGLVSQQRALSSIGYGSDVQQQLFEGARDQIARRQGRGQFAALSEAEIASRAYGQVNEHLDEALHGTRESRPEPQDSDVSLINELAEHMASGAGVGTASEEKGAGLPAAKAKAPTGMGMTKSRTPNQRARRNAVRDLVRGGKWNGLRDADAMAEARQNDLDLLTAKQRVRTAKSIAPEERNTMSAGADPEMRARRLAQPTFSTAQPGVGVAAEGVTLPARARPGAVSPVPPNLPAGPARLGRTRAERGLSDVRDSRREMRGGLAPQARDYSGAIADYAASRPQVTSKAAGARAERETARKAKLAARQGNVDVAQTKGS